MLSAVHVGLQALALASTSGNNYPGIRLWEGRELLRLSIGGLGSVSKNTLIIARIVLLAKLKVICESMLRIERKV